MCTIRRPAAARRCPPPTSASSSTALSHRASTAHARRNHRNRNSAPSIVTGLHMSCIAKCVSIAALMISFGHGEFLRYAHTQHTCDSTDAHNRCRCRVSLCVVRQIHNGCLSKSLPLLCHTGFYVAMTMRRWSVIVGVQIQQIPGFETRAHDLRMNERREITRIYKIPPVDLNKFLVASRLYLRRKVYTTLEPVSKQV